MDLRDYLRVIRQRWQLITACISIAVASAATMSLLTTPVYESSAKLFVRSADTGGDTNNAYTGSLLSQQRVKSYREFVTSPFVTREVASRLNIPGLTPGVIGSRVTADSSLDTVNLNIHGRDTDPNRARDLTQAVAEAFRSYVGSLEAPQSGASPVRLEIVVPAATGVQVLPRTKLNVALGLLVGLAIGMGLAVLKEVLDTRVKSPSDLEDRMQLATLAVIGFDPNAKDHPLIVHDDPRSPRAEAYRRLRTNLQFVDVDHRPRSIVVTSAVENEGKTTSVCNLAIATAEAGMAVILIDGDLRRPSIGNYLGLEQAVGLTNVLINQVPIDDALQPWGRSGKLWVLPAGTLPPNPSELLGSQHMHDLMRELETRAFVLIDTPPLLPVTDAAILSAEASGTLLVVRMNRTRREQVASAVESLSNVGAHLFGTVLNMAPAKGPDAYNYGYGYYGKYVGADPDPTVLDAAADDQPPGTPTLAGSERGPRPAASGGRATPTVAPTETSPEAPSVERDERVAEDSPSREEESAGPSSTPFGSSVRTGPDWPA